MQNPVPYTSIFHRKAHRSKKPSDLWWILGLVALGIMAFSWLITGQTRYVFPGPAVLFLIFRYGRASTEEVFFFVQRNVKGDCSYGWLDDDKKRHGDLPIEEYTYWCVEEDTMTMKKKYTLFMQFGNSGQTISLKEETELKEPPAGWPLHNEKVPPDENRFLITGLRDLAIIMDKVSVPEAVKSM
jgi:hypothetical protein